MRYILPVILATLIVTGATTSTQAGGLYVGGSMGQSFTDVEWDTDVEIDVDRSDFAWKLYGGYNIGRFLAVETGYVDLGKPSGSEGLAYLSQDLWGWDGTGLVKLNLGPLDLFGRYGFVLWRAKLSFGSSTGGVIEETDDGASSVIGGGVALVLPVISLRAEYEHFNIDRAGTPDLLTIGATITF